MKEQGTQRTQPRESAMAAAPLLCRHGRNQIMDCLHPAAIHSASPSSNETLSPLLTSPLPRQIARRMQSLRSAATRDGGRVAGRVVACCCRLRSSVLASSPAPCLALLGRTAHAAAAADAESRQQRRSAPQLHSRKRRATTAKLNRQRQTRRGDSDGPMRLTRGAAAARRSACAEPHPPPPPPPPH